MLLSAGVFAAAAAAAAAAAVAARARLFHHRHMCQRLHHPLLSTLWDCHLMHIQVVPQQQQKQQP
jgi:hypothetical protein